MIDNESLQQQLEAEQEPEDELTALETALGAALLLTLASLYDDYNTTDGFRLNPRKRKRFFERLSEVIGGHYTAVESFVRGKMEAAYTGAYSAFMDAYRQELGLPLRTLIDDDTIKQAVNSGYPLTKTMKHNQLATMDRLRREIRETMKRNEEVQQAMGRMQEVAKNDGMRVRAVVAQETATVQSKAQMQSVEDAERQGVGVDITWFSVGDNRVRDTHQRLHGQKADEEGYFYSSDCKGKGPRLFVGRNSARENINCRCYLETRGVNIQDDKRWKEFNSAGASSARREEFERRIAESKTRKQGDIS